MGEPIVEFLNKNQIFALLIYILLKEVWPFFRDKVFPHRMAEKDAETERVKKLEERQVKAEERQADAFEAMRNVTTEMSKSLMLTNERLSNLILSQNEDLRITADIHSTVTGKRKK